MKTQLIISAKVMLFLSLLLGVLYPIAMTVVAQTFFSEKANGSLIEHEGRIVGSRLMAQKTVSEKYFWPRPSASDYGAVPSGASNLGPTSKALKAAIDDRKSKGHTHDLLFASGSGLDPHISKDAALSQLPRIVQSRQLSENDKIKLATLVQQFEERRDFGIFGEPRVNVLLLNLAMDKTFSN